MEQTLGGLMLFSTGGRGSMKRRLGIIYLRLSDICYQCR